MKQALIAINDEKVSNELERTLSSVDVVPEHTINALDKVKPGLDFLEPDLLIISNKLARETRIVSVLNTLKKENLDKTEILFFTDHVDIIDKNRTILIGELIDRNIYPVFCKTITTDLIKESIKNPPTLAGEVKRISNQYHLMLEEQREDQRIEHIERKANEHNNVIAFASAGYNVGTSTIAENTSISLAKKGKKVLYLDANSNNHVANAFGLADEDCHMVDAVKFVEGKKEQDLTELPIQYSEQENLFILSNKKYAVSPTNLSKIVDFYQDQFDCVVLDLGKVGTTDSIALADTIYLIITMNNNLIKDSLKLLQYINSNHLSEKIQFILNQAPYKMNILNEDLLRSYGFPITYKVPTLFNNILWEELFNNEFLINKSTNNRSAVEMQHEIKKIAENVLERTQDVSQNN